MEFKLEIWLALTTLNEQDQAMQWIATNHGTEVIEARAIGTPITIHLQLQEATFNAVQNTRNSFINQYGSQLADWEMTMTQDPV